MVAEVSYYARLMAGVWQLVRTPMDPDPESRIRRQIDRRHEVFLDTLCRAVFDNPSNPYHRMLRAAGCTYGDLADSVHRHGLEPTLRKLLADVFAATDEPWLG